jgi:hypothetical protein
MPESWVATSMRMQNTRRMCTTAVMLERDLLYVQTCVPLRHPISCAPWRRSFLLLLPQTETLDDPLQHPIPAQPPDLCINLPFELPQYLSRILKGLCTFCHDLDRVRLEGPVGGALLEYVCETSRKRTCSTALRSSARERLKGKRMAMTHSRSPASRPPSHSSPRVSTETKTCLPSGPRRILYSLRTRSIGGSDNRLLSGIGGR